MAKNNIYKQCTMEKETETGKLVSVAWIPSCFAVIGKQLKLRREQGVGCVKAYSDWDDGWKVVAVGGTMSVDDLDSQRDAQKRWERVLADH